MIGAGARPSCGSSDQKNSDALWRRPMKSPFPGMDPYLEQFWPDIHASLVIYSRDQIEEQLPANLLARVEDGLILETEAVPHGVHPDVKSAERPGLGGAVAVAGR